MFKDEFYYNPKLSMFFKSPCMKFEGGDGGDSDGGDGGGGGGDPAPVALVDHEGKFSEKFLEHFDEGDRPTLERFQKTGLKSLGRSHVDLQRQFRSPDDYVKMLTDESSDEERAAFHKRRGVPAEAKDYPAYEIPEGLTNVSTTPEEQVVYNELFKKANLTPAQRKIMADGHYAYLDKMFGDAESARVEAENQDYDKADMELNKVLGRGKEQALLRAQAIMRLYQGEDVVNQLKGKNSSLMTLMFHRIAEDMAPARIAAIMGSTSPSIPTNDKINREMEELRNHPAYFDSQHPEHKKIMEKKTALSLQRTA